MTKIFILIILAHPWLSGKSSTPVEFNSLQACENAQSEIFKKIGDKYYVTLCVPKGELGN